MKVSLPPVEAVSRPSISAQFKIASPMYLHGANPAQLSDRILPQSVKGALRFWWRAVHWVDYFKAASGDRGKALKMLANADARLWGAADERIGQGAALMQIKSPRIKTGEAPVPSYLKGLGIKHQEALSPEQVFEITIHFKSPPEKLESDREQVRRALMAFGLFGGLGSRSRHGLGSVQLVRLDDERYDSWEASQKAIKELLQHSQEAPEPPYTAFSGDTLCYYIIRDDVRQVLDDISNELQDYRRSEFSDDADAILRVANGGSAPENYPRRAIFGLPHNYFFKDEGVKATVDGWHDVGGKLRRGSPLFIHVASYSKKAVGVLTLIEAQFLPKDSSGERLIIKADRNKCINNFSPDWRVIEDFLVRMPDAERIKP